MKNEITIGRLSSEAGVKIETVRYYEKIGLMPKPPRSAGRHRLYDEVQINRLKFIRRGRELGFPLDDIRSLMGLEDARPSCAEVYEITVHHLKGVREKITDLKRLEATLSSISKACDRSDDPDCPVIETLSGK